MIRPYIHNSIAWLKHVITEPRDELNRWQGAVRFVYELGVHGWKALNRDNATEMAAALGFRTLFALLPIMIVSTVLVKAVGGPEQFISVFRGAMGALGMYNVKLPSASEAVAGQPQTLGAWMEDLIRHVSAFNLEAIGWVGLALVIYAAIGLMVTIENSFNAIYGAPQGRSWGRRIPMYWLVLTVGPVLIGIALYLNNRLNAQLESIDTWKWLLSGLKITWGFVVTWLFIFAVYRLLPTTKVAVKAALAGSFIAALFLSIGKGSLDAYFSNAVSFQSLFGSLSAAPVFMFWVYLMWLVVLFGLEVSATIQTVTMQGLALEEAEQKRPQNGLVDPAAVVPVMEIISERFAQSRSVTAREIADETHIAESIVCQIIEQLHREGLVHRLSQDDAAVSLARPPEQISADQLIEIGYKLVDEGGVGRQSPLVQRLREAQKALARQATLASLLAYQPRPAPANQAPAR